MKKLTIMVFGMTISSLLFGEVPFKLGLAGYTFHKKNIAQTLEIMKDVDTHYLCIKDFHLSLDATDKEIADFKKLLSDAGVESTACGPIYMKDEATARKAFEFARRYGLKVVVGVPYEQIAQKDSWGERQESDRMLDIIEKLVKEYDICYAIHNHGPDIPKLFPTAESAMKRIASRDKRIGLCLDVGHERRAGHDPVESIKKWSDRIYDIHVKNIKVDAKKNIAMPGPRGELDIPGIFRALAEVGYSRVCHLEYERDFDNNLLGIAETIGYFRGVMDTVKVPAKMKDAPLDANTLSDEEITDGWNLLWDGKTLSGWLGVKNGLKSAPEKGWVIKDRTLSMLPVNGISPDGRWFPLPPEDQKLGGGGDIVTEKKYKDFAFKFDFRLTVAANSGVKYFYDETKNRGTTQEYQILENAHPDSDKGVGGNRRAGSLYDIYSAPLAAKVLKGPGEWNTGMIVAKGAKVEHWLNGVKVLEYERFTPEFRAAVNKSKYASWGDNGKPWGENPSGRILLQDHHDSKVAFCNLKIKEL